MHNTFFILILIFVVPSLSLAQSSDSAIVTGRVIDKSFELPLTEANIHLFNNPGVGTYTDKTGTFELQVPANKEIKIIISYSGYDKRVIALNLKTGEIHKLGNISLKNFELDLVQVTDRRIVINEPVPRIKSPVIASVGGDEFNSRLAFVAGVSVNNELSSGYSVRGGNFNENLVYVNDIQVYRPFLARSGQQEGLSFVNSNLVDSIEFSAGGWNAEFGDKLSSVLSIKYKEPHGFGGSVTGSLLGGSASIEHESKNHLFTQIHGIRYRTNKYVLNSLDVQGDYHPSFTDYQTYLTYHFNPDFSLSFLGNYSRNQYNFIPQNRETDFGNINQALRLTVYFDGQEISSFETMTGALAATWKPIPKVQLKFISSYYKTNEKELFDIQGQYWLDELERDLGNNGFGDVAFNRGVGTFLNHARNTLSADIMSLSHIGTYSYSSKIIKWGVTVQQEHIKDQLNEWQMIDSAGYSLPIAPPDQIILQNVIKSKNSILSQRITGFIQNKWAWQTHDTSDFLLFVGVRGNYWTYNNKGFISPRINFAWRPYWFVNKGFKTNDSITESYRKRRDVIFRFATGYYYQPPFYRELRGIDGKINPEVVSQKSLHFVLSGDYDFFLWKRPFKFTTALYYKYLWNINPYEYDDVRIRYFAKNNAKGYAAGVDFRLNGEFIPGIESYASLGLMKTEEDILDDYFYDYYNSDGEKIISGYTANNIATDSVRNEPGYIPRPTNQMVNFALFFQDEMPRWPSFKVHLSFYFGSSLPFGPPTYERYKDTLKMPFYRRVDIGFSKDLLANRDKSVKNFFKEMWISLEVFNLLGIDNTVSYLWIKDVTNRQYAVPNYLTSRRVNVKLYARF